MMQHTIEEHYEVTCIAKWQIKNYKIIVFHMAIKI